MAEEAKKVEAEKGQVGKVETATAEETEKEPAKEGEIVPAKEPSEGAALAAIQERALDPVAFRQMKMLATELIASKAVPSSFANASQVLMAMQAGYEMGMKPMQAVNSLYIVNGNLNIWGKALIRRVTEHGWEIKYSDESDAGCTVAISKDGRTVTDTYLFEDAEKSGYTKDSGGRLKIGWREGINRKLKLRYGALSLVIKSYVPEVLGSVADVVEVAQDYEPDKGSRARIEDALAKKRETGEKIVDDAEPAKPVKTEK